MPVFEINKWNGGISEYEDRGTPGAFKMGRNLDIHKDTDSLSSNQALIDEGLINTSRSASLSQSPSSSPSSSASASFSSSASISKSPSATPSVSVSASLSPSASISISSSPSPSSSRSASPSVSQAITSVYRDLILWFVQASDGYTYEFGSAGYIYRRDSSGFVARVYKDPNGRIVGASEWYSDSGKTYLYWATGRNLNRKPLPGLSNWNDVNQDQGWPKTNLNDVPYHTMREAGGSLIIANGNFMALVGYDDSYTNEALDLVPGNMAKTLVERNGRSVIGTYRASNPNDGINAAIDSEVYLAQKGSDGEIFYADMTSTIPVKRFPGGGKVNPGGVCNYFTDAAFFEWEQTALSYIDKQSIGNFALFAVYAATSGYNGIYSYGRKAKDRAFVLNLEYELEADELGALANVNGILLVSYRSGTEFSVKAVDTTQKAIGVYEGLDLKAPIKTPSAITTWKYIELFLSPLPSGASIEFWYRMNKNGSFVQAKTLNGEATFTTAGEKKALFSIEAEGDIYEQRLVLNPTGNQSPEVYRARTYFE